MRIPGVLLALTLLLASPPPSQVLASSSSSSSSSSLNLNLNSNTRSSRGVGDDLYLDDFGSGEGPEGVEEVTHFDHEGSGHGPFSHDTKPYGATYDDYDDTEDDYDDEPLEDLDGGFIVEGSGHGVGDGVIIDDDDPFRGPEIIEEPIIVEEIPEVKESPPPAPVNTLPPPQSHPDHTSLAGKDMESPVQIHTTMTEERQVSIFAQPGILAAFIGGAVVGLLCAILLVMFIVYRMRKKDEGSYPLDEPKRMPLTSSYSPNDKEIYA